MTILNFCEKPFVKNNAILIVPKHFFGQKIQNLVNLLSCQENSLQDPHQDIHRILFLWTDLSDNTREHKMVNNLVDMISSTYLENVRSLDQINPCLKNSNNCSLNFFFNNIPFVHLLKHPHLLRYLLGYLGQDCLRLPPSKYTYRNCRYPVLIIETKTG